MNAASSHSLHARSPRRSPLAFALAAALGAAVIPSLAAAATQTVTNCNDAGAGSLRAAVLAAGDSDLVDASHLTTANPGCAQSTISLKTGDIATSHNGITIKGPGIHKLTVTALYINSVMSHQYKNRIFTHAGTGSISIDDLTVANGYVVDSGSGAKGGCIYTAGTVNLTNVAVNSCQAATVSGNAKGGGIYSKAATYLTTSIVDGNIAYGGTSGTSTGGGVSSHGNFTATQSTVSGNSAYCHRGDTNAFAGGALVYGSSTIVSSTISSNISGQFDGGLDLIGYALIKDSTISGNYSENLVGGVFIAGNAGISNTTIANNTARQWVSGNNYFAAGLAMPGAGTGRYDVPEQVLLYSTIISNNTIGAIEKDLSVTGAPNTYVDFLATKNLVGVSNDHTDLAGDTIFGVCPLLGPLRDNGGPTWTQALMSSSPAIDKGNNFYGLANDQRGPPYLRVSGSAGDIGAYEVQQADIVFNSGFDGCP